jgi:hypothetical protein
LTKVFSIINKLEGLFIHLFLCLCKDSCPLSSLSLDSELDEELSDDDDEDEEQLELSDARPDACSTFTCSATAAKSGFEP